MAASRWIFTKDQLANTPSRKSGIDADKELSYRQQAATLIQDMGQRLSVTQLCINTAIVYMHRYYMFQTFTRFPRNEMAPACLFLAAKVEEQPRKLEHVIKVAHSCLHRDNTPAPDVKSEAYLEQAQTLVINENILLQTLGFDVTVDHPHTNVVKLTQLVKDVIHSIVCFISMFWTTASKDLSQTSYFLATNSLHMTTFCLQYRPTVVACVCIYLACKWSNWKIPKSNEGKEWFQYIDRSVTQEMLDERYKEFLDILEKYPHKLRKKIMGWKGERTEGITKADLEGAHSPSSTSSGSSSRHDHRRETSTDHRREHHDRKEPHKAEGSAKRESLHHGENKDRGDPNDPKSGKYGMPERKEGHHPDRREQSHGHNRDIKYRDMKDGSDHRHAPSDRKSLPHMKPSTETSSSENRSQSTMNHAGNPKPSVNDSVGGNSAKPGSESIPSTAQSQPNTTSEMHRSKSETTLNYKEYLKRKEQEKMEKMQKERLERERLEKERMLKMKMMSESESLNKSFSEAMLNPDKKDAIIKPEKNRPPKLNISSSQQSISSKTNERPYEVNIKSPIKPHHNIKVKSPIKSSDLKQPKLEITKVQITPEKDGSDPFSVNINEDPNIKKMVDNIKKEPGATPTETRTELSEGNLSLSNHDRTASPRVKVKQESTSPRVKKENSGSPRVKLKQESGGTPVKIKQEVKPERPGVDSPIADIQLLPEHTAPPSTKIRELNYDPDRVTDSPTSLKLTMKSEPGSGRSTPVISQIKSEPGSGASPLKLKISTKGLKPDGESSGSSQHGSPHSKHHKHKHKSHKHGKDKHRDRHEHRDKHGTNGHSLKMSIKLSNIPGTDSKHKHEKHKQSISDTNLNKNNNAGDFGERQQPWSMSDLMSQSASNPEASRKRRRTPTVDQSVDVASQIKQPKVDSHRLRRSSSSHSVISMELSDGDNSDERLINGPGTGSLDQPKVLNQLQESLQQMIDQTKKKNVMTIQQQQHNNVTIHQHKHRQGTNMNSQSASARIDRQQSGFDLEGMMWSGTSDQPPLPNDSQPPLPMSPPPRNLVPPPPPPQ